jgi:hypothetical protein
VTRVVSYDINPIWGTHTSILERELAALPSGSLVVEHGAGVYSTPLIARFNVRVICIEDLQGWRDWASWIYGMAGREVRVEDWAKPVVPVLPTVSLVFIDGIIRERGDLLKWALAAKVPTIIAHDTEDDYRKMYGYSSHLFREPGYEAGHDGGRPQTTVWKLKSQRETAL